MSEGGHDIAERTHTSMGLHWDHGRSIVILGYADLGIESELLGPQEFGHGWVG